MQCSELLNVRARQLYRFPPCEINTTTLPFLRRRYHRSVDTVDYDAVNMLYTDGKSLVTSAERRAPDDWPIRIG